MKVIFHGHFFLDSVLLHYTNLPVYLSIYQTNLGSDMNVKVRVLEPFKENRRLQNIKTSQKLRSDIFLHDCLI